MGIYLFMQLESRDQSNEGILMVNKADSLNYCHIVRHNSVAICLQKNTEVCWSLMFDLSIIHHSSRLYCWLIFLALSKALYLSVSFLSPPQLGKHNGSLDWSISTSGYFNDTYYSTWYVITSYALLCLIGVHHCTVAGW